MKSNRGHPRCPTLGCDGTRLRRHILSCVEFLGHFGVRPNEALPKGIAVGIKHPPGESTFTTDLASASSSVIGSPLGSAPIPNTRSSTRWLPNHQIGPSTASRSPSFGDRGRPRPRTTRGESVDLTSSTTPRTASSSAASQTDFRRNEGFVFGFPRPPPYSPRPWI
jgi:hypothetical protein